MKALYRHVVGAGNGDNAILVAANANFVTVHQTTDVIIFTPDQAEELSKQILLAAAAVNRAKAELLPPTLPHLDDEFFPEVESLSPDASQETKSETSPVSGDAGIQKESQT